MRELKIYFTATQDRRSEEKVRKGEIFLHPDRKGFHLVNFGFIAFKVSFTQQGRAGGRGEGGRAVDFSWFPRLTCVSSTNRLIGSFLQIG